MRVNEYLTTDELIDRLNALPDVYAVKEDVYGIALYDCRDADEDQFMMNVGLLDTDLGDTYHYGEFPEDMNDDECRRISALLEAYVRTPIMMRDEWPGGAFEEALRHQLTHFASMDCDEQYRKGAYDAYKDVFTTLGMMDTYKPSISAGIRKRPKHLKAVK